MLVQLGKRNETLHVVDLLVECHGRIRRFLGIARQLAEVREPTTDVVRDTAGQVRRYFSEALPLHIADEDDQVSQSLRGHSDSVDEALDKMSQEHVHHEVLVARLIDVCTLLQREPERLEELAMELRDAAVLLQAAFEPHLAREETVIFPALRTLPASDLDAIKAAMRDRREVR
jgi:hemerythrin-like domain-containing protein